MLDEKDFKAVAEIIKKETSNINPHYLFVPQDRLIVKLADYFAIQNLQFDRDRFMQACGLD